MSMLGRNELDMGRKIYLGIQELSDMFGSDMLKKSKIESKQG